ncbi:MAG: PAS domain-containing protein [Acetobacteraceae bacterium]|nr:PAS domain-containing protein [Acetobacteraceae bacterium]
MSSPVSFPIVGIGASAGGVEALEGFFRGLPDEPGLAVVIVTHLSPQRESILHEIIARYTSMTVQVAADGMRVDSNKVYVLPADAVLSIEGDRLRIRKPPKSRSERKPIDIFLSALAANQGEMAAGIILSGSDSDGTLGIKAIKERGGLTLAQIEDGYGPHHTEMPDNAIATGFVDFAVPADEMGSKLVEFVRGLKALNEAGGLMDGGEGQSIDNVRPEIYNILRTQIGHDFSGYKSRTFVRRVQRRMQVTQARSVDGYVEQLRQEPREVGALFRDLLINVTNFFRDGDAFESLARDVMPKLFEGRGADDTVRIWVPGCSTGEEVFSIGMLLREEMDKLPALPRVQVFATDIDERALMVARAARYPAALLDSVSPERRSRFFVPDGGSFVVAKEVRDLCIFSPHSVIRDPPFSRINLVSCRNLLIYFGTDVQNQVIPTFHYALHPDGYLFLGTAENISQFDDLFAPVDKRSRIFRRRSDGPTMRLPLTLHNLRPGHIAELMPRQPLGGAALRQAVDSQVLERFAPPHVVVNREANVVYFSPKTGKYLEPPAGQPSRQLMAMARKGLRLDLRTIFRETIETGRTTTRDGIAVEGDDGRIQVIRLIAEPLADRAGGEPLYLVLFEDDGPVLSREEAENRFNTLQDSSAAQLERELREARDRLQSIVEEYETALEELKSSNEELVSVNEELQSTNEELEASKEELQSLNEELHTVNAELNAKVEALDRANSDLQNLFDSTDIATVFLDQDLVIRSYTPMVSEMFNILPSDRGRPITDLSSKFPLPGFADDLARAFRENQRLERRIEDSARLSHYLLRVAPYRDTEEKTRGVVVTFVNVTGMVEAEERQRVLIGELQHRTRNLLAVVQSIAQQTVGKSGSLVDFEDRLAALSRVQSLVNRLDGESLDLGDLVRQELEAIGGHTGDRILVSGPPLPLRLEHIQTLALVLHELATNALKHGALRGEEGRLHVAWSVEGSLPGDILVTLDWQETGVTMPATPPTRHGYGRLLIEKSLAFSLRAKTKLAFEPSGVRCRIQFPIPGTSRDETVF